MEKKYIYKIVEKNVDGCGTDAWLFIEVKTPITNNLNGQLKSCLLDAKRLAAEDYDTESMVLAALEVFAAKTGIECKVCKDPYEGEITF